MHGENRRRVYNEEALNEIRAQVDIVEIISSYVALKQTGSNYKGLCPFHAEKTPSFTVSADKQLFHCFGCGVGGDIFSFVMKIENVSFQDAAKILAQKIGISLFKDESFQEKAAREKKRRLYHCLDAACAYYQEVFAKNKEAQKAKDYIKKRGLSLDTAKHFRIGYSPSAWENLSKDFIKQGFSHEELISVGLIVPSKHGKGYYDRFRGRLMFPITDIHERVIGFGGRVLDDSVPKYLNSPETTLFKKGKTVYGLALARNYIRQESKAIIVEGYTDVIICHQFGFKNVVATLGTAFTKEQAESVLRYTNQIIIAFDADAAGGAASLRSMKILNDLGAEVKVAILPKGEDPDSMLREHGKQALEQVLKDSKSLIAYRLHLITSQTDISKLDQRVKAAKKAARILADIDSAVEQGEYAEKVANTLGVSKDAMLGDIRKLTERERSFTRRSWNKRAQDRLKTSRDTKFKDDIARSSEDSQVLKAERLLLQLIVKDKEILDMVLAKLNWSEFFDEKHKILIRAIQTNQDVYFNSTRQENSVLLKIIEYIDDEKVIEYAKNIFAEENKELSGPLKKAAEDCINVIRKHRLSKRVREIEKELMNLNYTREMQKSKELLAELAHLKKKISKELQPFRGIS